MEKVKPLKRFGQNYLKDINILKKIADEVDPRQGDNLLEIGPGQGALTNELLKKIDKISIFSSLFVVLPSSDKSLLTILNFIFCNLLLEKLL